MMLLARTILGLSLFFLLAHLGLFLVFETNGVEVSYDPPRATIAGFAIGCALMATAMRRKQKQ